MAEESKSKSGPAATPGGPAGGGGAAKPLTPEQVPRGAGRERAERRASGHVQSAQPSRRMRLDAVATGDGAASLPGAP